MKKIWIREIVVTVVGMLIGLFISCKIMGHFGPMYQWNGWINGLSGIVALCAVLLSVVLVDTCVNLVTGIPSGADSYNCARCYIIDQYYSLGYYEVDASAATRKMCMKLNLTLPLKQIYQLSRHPHLLSFFTAKVGIFDRPISIPNYSERSRYYITRSMLRKIIKEYRRHWGDTAAESSDLYIRLTFSSKEFYREYEPIKETRYIVSDWDIEVLLSDDRYLAEVSPIVTDDELVQKYQNQIRQPGDYVVVKTV